MESHPEGFSGEKDPGSAAEEDPTRTGPPNFPPSLLSWPDGLALSLSLAVNLALLQWLALSQVVSLREFVGMTVGFYAWASFLLALLLSLLFGIAAAKLALVGQGIADPWSWMSLGLGATITLLSSGCPACDAPLLNALGIRDGLAAYPLQGLDLKLLGGLLLGMALWTSTRGTGERREDAGAGIPAEVAIGRPAVRVRKPRLLLPLILLLSIMATYLLPRLPDQVKVHFLSEPISEARAAHRNISGNDGDSQQQAAVPERAYALGVTYGDIGPALISGGAIDYERFSRLYDQVGDPLTSEQRQILRSGSDRRIIIDESNAHFLLNLFWAFGLSNRNAILEQGAMAEFSEGDIGRFASTGGWTLGRRPSSELYSALEILRLTPEQQRVVERVANRVYRPCCNNHAAFPDCNHGMAMLGVLELMAAQGAKEADMFEAAKQINGFWFPYQMQHIAAFFEATQGWDFAEVPGERGVGPEVFSAAGHRDLVTWMTERGMLDRTPGGGASCGV